MAHNFGYNPRGHPRNQNPRFANRHPGPPNQRQPFLGDAQNFLANLSSFFRPRHATPDNQFRGNSGNQFGQNRFPYNSGFQNQRPTGPNFRPRFISSKPKDEYQQNSYQWRKQDTAKSNQPHRKESQNETAKTESAKSNDDNQKINEKEKSSELKDEGSKVKGDSDSKVDSESVDKETCDVNDVDMDMGDLNDIDMDMGDLNDVDMDIDEDEEGDTDAGNIDVYDVSGSQQEKNGGKSIGHQDKKVADLQKDVSESPKRDVEKDVKKDVNKQEKPNTTESPKTSEKSKDINTQSKNINTKSKVTPESTKDIAVTTAAAAAAKNAKKEEEEEDSDSEDTGYCSYCKMEFTSADAYWKHTRGLLHTQKLMEADTSTRGSPQTTKKTSQPEEPATSTYFVKRGELVTAATIKEGNITETPKDLYESFPKSQNLESSKPNIVSQYKSVPGTQKSEQFKSVPGNQKSEQYKNVPGIQKSEQFKSVPGNQKSEQYKNVPGNQKSEQYKNVPGTQKSEQYKNVPGNQKSEQYKNVPGNQKSEQYKNVPGIQKSEQFKSVPGNQKSEQYKNVPGNQKSEQYKNVPGTQKSEQYKNVPGNQKSEQYKNVPGNQKSEQYKNVPNKKLETGKPNIESQYYGDGFQSNSDNYDNYKGYDNNEDDYEDLEDLGTKMENWMDVDTSKIQKVSAKDRDLTPDDIGKTVFPNEFYCQLCDVRCTGSVTYKMHLDGRTHKTKVEAISKVDKVMAERFKPKPPVTGRTITLNREPKINKLLAECGSPLIGLQYITEYHRDDEKTVRYVCNQCESKCDGATIIPHVMGSRHRMKYFKEHHNDIHVHLMQYSSTRKKSDLNASAEMFARDIENQEGRSQVKVKLEIAETTEKAAIQLIKSAAAEIPELLSYTEKGESKNVSSSDQKEVEGYSDYNSGYSYHSSGRPNEKGGKSSTQTRDGNHEYYSRNNPNSYEDTEGYYDSEYGYTETYDYGHGQRGSKRSLEPDSRASKQRGILKSSGTASKSYTEGASGNTSKSYGGHEEWYGEEDTSGYGYDNSYGYDENYGYGAGDYSGYGDDTSYNEHESYYGQQDTYDEDYTAPYGKKNISSSSKPYEGEPPAKISRKNQPRSTFEQWEEEEGVDTNSQESAGYGHNYPDEEPEELDGYGNDKNFPDLDKVGESSENSKNLTDQDRLAGSSSDYTDWERPRCGPGSGIKQDQALVPGASRGLNKEQDSSANLSDVIGMFSNKDQELFLQFLQFKKMVESGGDVGSFGRSMMQTDHSDRYEEQHSQKPYPSTDDDIDPYTGSPVVQKFDYGHKASPKTTQKELYDDTPKPEAETTDPGSLQQGKDIESDQQPKITDMLSSLSSSLISTEEEAEMALQVSNALTQALLQYRLRKLPQNVKASLPEETKQLQQSSIMPQQQQQHTEIQAGDSKKIPQQLPTTSKSKPAESPLSSSSSSSTTPNFCVDLESQDPTLPTIHRRTKQKQPLGSERGSDIQDLLNTINTKDLQKVMNAEKTSPPEQEVSTAPDIKQLLSSINPAELQKALNMAQNPSGGQNTPSLKGDDIQKILNSISPADLQKVAAAVQSQPNPVPHPLGYGQSPDMGEYMDMPHPTINVPSSQPPPTSQHMMPQQRPPMLGGQHPTYNVPTSQHMMVHQWPPMMGGQNPNFMPHQNMMMHGMQPGISGWNEQMHGMPHPQQGMGPQHRGGPMGVNPPLPQGPHPQPPPGLPPGPPPNAVQPPPPPSSQTY